MIDTANETTILNLLSCKVQITIWEQLYFNKGCIHFAQISIRSEDEKYYLQLSVDCKTVNRLRISEKAFDALSVGQPSAHFENIKTFTINQFVPAGSEALNPLEYE